MICCIELPKVNPDGRPVEQLTPLEICLEYLRHADEKGGAYVDELIRRGGKELEMTQRMLEKTTQEERLREKALAREKFQWDISINMIVSYRRGLREGHEQGRSEGLAQGRSEGLVQGRSEGLAQGRMEERRMIAFKMKKSGKSVEEIADTTGLPPEETERL